MPNNLAQGPLRTDRVAVSVANATHMSGLGRTKLYEALSAGALSSVKIGSRRLILVDDLRDWLASQRHARTPRGSSTPRSRSPASAGKARCASAEVGQ